MGNNNSGWNQLEDELVKLGLYDESYYTNLVSNNAVKSKQISINLTCPGMNNIKITLMIDDDSVRIKRVFDSLAKELHIFGRPYDSSNRPTITLVKNIKSFKANHAIEALRNMCSAEPDYDSVILENKGKYSRGPDDKQIVFDRSSSDLMRTCMGMMVFNRFDKNTPSIVKDMIDNPLIKRSRNNIVFSIMNDSNDEYMVYGLTRPENNCNRIIPYSYTVNMNGSKITSVTDLRIDVFSRTRAEDDGMFFRYLLDNAKGNKNKKNKVASFKAAKVKGTDDKEFTDNLFNVLFCALYGYPELADKYVKGLEISDDFDKFLGRNVLELRSVCVFFMSYLSKILDDERKLNNVKLKTKELDPSGFIGSIIVLHDAVMNDVDIDQLYTIRPVGKGKFKIIANMDTQSTGSDSYYESIVKPDKIESTMEDICHDLV